jgi:hypothetical protein
MMNAFTSLPSPRCSENPCCQMRRFCLW